MLFEFPKLTGSYSVGFTEYSVIDKTRPDLYSNTPVEKRPLAARIWYPSKADKNALAQYAVGELDDWKKSLEQKGYPQKFIEEIYSIRCHAIEAAPFLKDKAPYPLVFFSHGYCGSPIEHTAMCEELASHGYIVVGVYHTYYAYRTPLPDDRAIHALKEHLDQVKLLDEEESSQEQYIRTADIIAILDDMQKNRLHDILKNADFENIGIFGFSFGGSTAADACTNYPQFNAGIDLDGALFGDINPDDIEKPFLFILGGGTIDRFNNKTNEELAQITGLPAKLENILRSKYMDLFYNRRKEFRSNLSLEIIPKIYHGAFTDWLILKDLALYKDNKHIVNLDMLLSEEPIDGKKTMQLINQHIVTFFNKHLHEQSDYERK
jgi:dienelactone hydrolase